MNDADRAREIAKMKEQLKGLEKNSEPVPVDVSERLHAKWSKDQETFNEDMFITE